MPQTPGLFIGSPIGLFEFATSSDYARSKVLNKANDIVQVKLVEKYLNRLEDAYTTVEILGGGSEPYNHESVRLDIEGFRVAEAIRGSVQAAGNWDYKTTYYNPDEDNLLDSRKYIPTRCFSFSSHGTGLVLLFTDTQLERYDRAFKKQIYRAFRYSDEVEVGNTKEKEKRETLSRQKEIDKFLSEI